MSAPVMHAQRPVPDPFRRKGPSVGLILGIIGIVLLALLSVVVVFVLSMSVPNPLAVVFSSVLALIPLGFVVWAVWAIDRWEPEPRIALWFSALWGGIAAVLLTLGGNMLIETVVIPLFIRTEAQYEFYATVIQAPIMEELWKAIPIALMFFFFRKHFDGPVDGMVIGALSAAGFAYTENILYFGRQFVETNDATFIFFLRGIMSPLTHAIFTAAGTGLLMGLAARRTSWAWGLLAFPVGWGISALLHALWNSAGFWVPGGMAGFFIFYAVVQVPICLAVVFLVLLIMRNERRITKLRLDEYASAGWFTHEEANQLASSDGRATFLAWASKRGLKSRMRAYIHRATRLANNRQRAVTGRDKLRTVSNEAELLREIADLRRSMATAAAGTPVHVHAGTMLARPVHGIVPDAQRFAGGMPTVAGWGQRPPMPQQQPPQQYPPQR